MRALRVGCKGEDVLGWQFFLRGQGIYLDKVDGDFGPKTEKATKAFQSEHGIADSGVVDDMTLAAAMLLGFKVVDDQRAERSGPNWPIAPVDLDMQPLTQEGREIMFGKFSYTPKPMAGNPEAIAVSSAWVRENIVSVKIPLPDAAGKVVVRPVAFHKAGAEKLRALFEAWQADGLLSRVLTWDGSYAPRFIRGSRTTLSSHAWGSAFDINARWNALGVVPALLGKRGCVRELVERANELGFWWGGHFPGRKDGMHLELVRL